MENLLATRNELEKALRHLDSGPAYIELLYCQKSINEAIFWVGKLIEKRDSETKN